MGKARHFKLGIQTGHVNAIQMTRGWQQCLYSHVICSYFGK